MKRLIPLLLALLLLAGCAKALPPAADPVPPPAQDQTPVTPPPADKPEDTPPAQQPPAPAPGDGPRALADRIKQSVAGVPAVEPGQDFYADLAAAQTQADPVRRAQAAATEVTVTAMSESAATLVISAPDLPALLLQAAESLTEDERKSGSAVQLVKDKLLQLLRAESCPKKQATVTVELENGAPKADAAYTDALYGGLLTAAQGWMTEVTQ